jgi:dihydroorotase
VTIDLLIQGGRVVDPSQSINGRYDIAISGGRIAALAEPGRLPAQLGGARKTLDASGTIVTPGLIDLHAHVFPGRTPLGIEADRVGIEQSVTTLVDAGSAGARTFATFLDEAVKPAGTRVLAFLNIAGEGLCGGLSELADMDRLTPREAVALIREQPLIRGIKARMSASVVRENGIKPLLVAKEAAREAGCPLMVHIGNAPPALSEILRVLDAGDVVTHAFHGKAGGILDERGRLIPEAEKALARGVLFDVGHGTSSFSFRTMRQARALGLAPHTISTDIYRQNAAGPVHSLTTTMTKFVALGYSLEEVIAACTAAPAAVLRMTDEIGTLRPGAVADLSVLELTNVPVVLTDSEREQLTAEESVTARLTIKAGKVLTCR